MLKFLGGLTKTPGFLKPLLGDRWTDEFGTAAGFAVGGPAGAAIGRGLGTAAGGGNLRESLVNGVQGYGMGMGAGALGLKGGTMLGGLGLGGARAATAAPQPASKYAQAAAKVGMGSGGGGAGDRAGGFDLGSLGGSIWDFVKENPEIALGGVSAGLNAVQGARADASRREGVDLLRQRSQEGAPMRAMAGQMLLRGVPQRRSLAGVFEDPTNPFFARA